MSYSVHLPGWPKGVDNIHADYELAHDALRRAVNVDITDAGKVRRRRGSTLKTALVGAHSLWADPNVPGAFYAAGTTLYALSTGLVSTVVATGLMFGRAVAYLHLNGDVFWSNGVFTGRIRNGVNMPWGVETPAGNAAMVATVGSMPAGTYQVVTTFKNAAGEEGSAQNALSITLLAAGGIALTNLPRAVSADVVAQCIYMTPTNGDVLFKIAQLPIATTVYTASTLGSPTVALRTQDHAVMPAGDIIAHLNGVIYVAAGQYVYYSEPMRYGLYNPAKNFYAFPDKVDVLLATPDGLHVCADRSYFISAPGTEGAAQRVTLPFGAIAGTGVYLPGNIGVAWFSPRGQVVATGSQVEVVTEKSLIPGIMASGVSMVREQQGVRQIVNVVFQVEPNPLEYTGA